MTQINTGLLVLIRTRKRFLTSGLITLLIGGWLSVLCQQCFANSNDNLYPDTETSHSRGHCLPDNTDQNHNNGYEHCKVACDCNSVIATSDKYQNSQFAVVKISFNDNQFSVVNADHRFLLNVYDDPEISLYKNPALFRLLPLERFHVLLI